MMKFCPFTKEWCTAECRLWSDDDCALNQTDLTKAVSALDDSVMVLVEEIRNFRSDIWNMVHDNGRNNDMD